MQTDVSPVFGELQHINAGVLNVAYLDDGPVDGTVVVLLHGWPYDIHSFVEVVPELTAAGYRVIVPYLRGFGSTTFLSANTARNGQQSAVASDVIALLDALNVSHAIFGGFDWGARTAVILAALWPERCDGLVAVSGYIVTNLDSNRQPLPPIAEYGWWYQYYFATERGRLGYDANRRAFNRLIWKLASPVWEFDDETYDLSANAFDNPDHVDIVIHNYRWRLGLAEGEEQYQDLEHRLAQRPLIDSPTITISSDFDGPAADGAGYADRFVGPYEHRVLVGVGHNVPQEAPRQFTDAIFQAAAMQRSHTGLSDLSARRQS